MTQRPLDVREMLRRALDAQVDMGLGEMILNWRQPAPETPRMISVSEAMNQADMFGVGSAAQEEAQYGSLDEHCRDICGCQSCPLGATRNKFVYGVGNAHADLMFIGEAPGADEDRLGEPFVGRAGRLLDRILAAIGLSRHEVYIANILKCRPPDNRDPLPDEMDKCMPYLLEQIRLLKPKLICALGRVAAQALLKKSTPLGRLRGQWHQFAGIPMWVTYHPAALLRFPAYKKETWLDMQALKKRYDELT